MKKALLFFVLVAAIASVSMGGIGGCGSTTATRSVDGSDDGTGDSDGSGDAEGSKSWSESGSALAISDIVNGDGASALVLTTDGKEATTSTDAAFYFGRFLLADEDSRLFSGSIKFKLNAQDSSSAFFSDFSLEHYSEVTDFDAHSDIVSSSTDLAVDDAYDASSNHVEIADATGRFVAFELDFGNNDYFGDITNAGVIFSSDKTTMAGGNNDSFFFIAQKVDSQPDVSESALLDDYNIRNFTVSNSGDITPVSTSTVTVGGTGSNGFTAFTGTDSETGAFNGELALTDATSGAFLFGYGDSGIAGAFLVAADQSLAVGIDISSGSAVYFAAER